MPKWAADSPTQVGLTQAVGTSRRVKKFEGSRIAGAGIKAFGLQLVITTASGRGKARGDRRVDCLRVWYRVAMLDGDLLRLGLAADERGERDAHLVVHARRLVDVIGTDEEFRQEGARGAIVTA